VLSRGRLGFVRLEHRVRVVHFICNDVLASVDDRDAHLDASAMLGLDAYGSSSDDEAQEREPSPAPRAREARVDAPRPAAAQKPSFGNLPKPGGARRVVTIPAPALARALEDDDDSDSDDHAAKRARRAGANAEASGGKIGSLAAALPKPKRALGGGGGGLGGGGGGVMLDLGDDGEDSVARGHDEDEDEDEDEEAGPSAHAASMYAVDDDGEYVNRDAHVYAADAYAVSDDAEQTRANLSSGDFVDQALAAAAKVERERHGRDIEIMTISADDLRKAPQRPGAAIIQHEGALSNIHTTQTSATAKHKHQLTSLLHEAKVEESRILEAGLKANQTRATNRRKYGW